MLTCDTLPLYLHLYSDLIAIEALIYQYECTPVSAKVFTGA